jgi:hypothetical protein
MWCGEFENSEVAHGGADFVIHLHLLLAYQNVSYPCIMQRTREGELSQAALMQSRFGHYRGKRQACKAPKLRD